MGAARMRSPGGVAPEVLATILCVTGAAFDAAGAASTGSVCVACVEPDRRYRCEVTADRGEIDIRALPLLCATRIAQDNGHSSCGVTRGSQTCDGVVKVYGLSQLAPPSAGSPEPPTGALRDGVSDAEAKAEEPATVEEMTRETLNKSRENARRAGQAIEEASQSAQGALRGAGEAMGEAAKRTWKCLGSGECWADPPPN
jgi:hypothetical protein